MKNFKRDEMTQEEKARAYDEALERADSLTEKYGGRDFAEYVFPELAESEDERIRKELKEAFEAYDIESTWNGIPIRSIFAWLEKQKEQKPAEWSEDAEQAAARYERENRQSVLTSVDIVNAFMAGAKWMEGRK